MAKFEKNHEFSSSSRAELDKPNNIFDPLNVKKWKMNVKAFIFDEMNSFWTSVHLYTILITLNGESESKQMLDP